MHILMLRSLSHISFKNTWSQSKVPRNVKIIFVLIFCFFYVNKYLFCIMAIWMIYDECSFLSYIHLTKYFRKYFRIEIVIWLWSISYVKTEELISRLYGHIMLSFFGTWICIYQYCNKPSIGRPTLPWHLYFLELLHYLSYLSSVFLNTFSDSAFTILSGRLFNVSIILFEKKCWNFLVTQWGLNVFWSWFVLCSHFSWTVF